MEIQRETLRELQYLQEDIAAYFTDEHIVSGETYWTCVESVAIAKLAAKGSSLTKSADSTRSPGHRRGCSRYAARRAHRILR